MLFVTHTTLQPRCSNRALSGSLHTAHAALELGVSELLGLVGGDGGGGQEAGSEGGSIDGKGRESSRSRYTLTGTKAHRSSETRTEGERYLSTSSYYIHSIIVWFN